MIIVISIILAVVCFFGYLLSNSYQKYNLFSIIGKICCGIFLASLCIYGISTDLSTEEKYITSWEIKDFESVQELQQVRRYNGVGYTTRTEERQYFTVWIKNNDVYEPLNIDCNTISLKENTGERKLEKYQTNILPSNKKWLELFGKPDPRYRYIIYTE